MHKIFFTTILACALLLVGCGDNPDIEAPTTAVTVSQPDKTTVPEQTTAAEKTIAAEENTDPEYDAEGIYYVIDTHTEEQYGDDGELLLSYYTYPELLIDDAVEKKYPKLASAIEQLNADMKAQAEKMGADAYDFALLDWQEHDEDFIPLLPYCYELSIAEASEYAGIFSIKLTEYASFGGPHPNMNYFACNYNKAYGNKLAAKDIFADSENSGKRLAADVKAAYPDAVFFTEDLAAELQGFVDEDRLNFSIGIAGIELWFNPYDIAPYAQGPIELHYSYSEHQDLLNADLFK